MSLFAVFHVRNQIDPNDPAEIEFVDFHEDLESARDSASRAQRAKGGRCEIDCNGHTVEVIRSA